MPVGVKNFPPVRDRIIISIRRFLFPRKGRKQAGKHGYEARFRLHGRCPVRGSLGNIKSAPANKLAWNKIKNSFMTNFILYHGKSACFRYLWDFKTKYRNNIMKKTLMASLMLVLLSVMTMSCTSTPKQEKVLRHVVMFGFKPEVSSEQVKEVEDAFCKLPEQIDLIKGYEWGTDCSPEGLQKGLTHCFFLTFHTEADRNAYLVHPAHKAFGKVLGNKASAITVVDYWTK